MYVTFDEISLFKFTIFQQMERIKTKYVSQWVEVDATPSSQVGTISIEISSYVTPGGDNIAGLDAEQIEKDIELFATI